MSAEPIRFLCGARVYLRPLELADAPAQLRWINDPLTRKYLGRCHPLNLVQEEAWIEGLYAGKTDVTLAIVLQEGDRHIGSLGLHGIEPINQTAVTGMLIGEAECRGKGYGPEAKELMLAYGFNTLNLRTIRSATFATNTPSMRSLQKSGYVEVGRIPDRFFRDGAWHDEVQWVITREAWLART